MYTSYRVCVIINKKLIHIIEIFLRKHNCVNDIMTFDDVKELKLVKIIDENKNIHMTINCEMLIKSNIISLINRIDMEEYSKAWQDYKRILMLIELINSKIGK